jgi:hypothetical protein
MPAFHDLRDAAPDDVGPVAAGEGPVAEFDPARRDLADARVMCCESSAK